MPTLDELLAPYGRQHTTGGSAHATDREVPGVRENVRPAERGAGERVVLRPRLRGVMQYAVTATVGRKGPDGWASTRQLPTFYLDARVQGIVSVDHAVRIARSIIDPYDEGIDVSLSVVEVDEPEVTAQPDVYECGTCGYSTHVVDRDERDAEHMRYDGAHYASWYLNGELVRE